MTLDELRRRAVEQFGLEAEDIAETQPNLDGYINEGYRDMQLRAYKPRLTVEHVTAQDGRVPFSALRFTPLSVPTASMGSEALAAWVDEETQCIRVPEAQEEQEFTLRYRYLFRVLEDGEDRPRVPEWTHSALADWATWRMYTNGNPQKQNRGQAFRARYEEVLRQIKAMGAQEPGYGQMHGLYANPPRL